MDALLKAIEVMGGVTKLARAIGTGQNTVSNWLLEGRKVPAERCLPIERATGGLVTKEELRPDIFGHPPNRGRAA